MAQAGADFWVATQTVLQAAEDPLVDKPRLTDKLLAKPPFRFLHDVITAVQTKTGFAPGLFAAQELDAHAIQDKEGKVAYLTKIIAVVSLALNEAVPAKPLKIVAGLEPDHTNTFLQMLGRAAHMGPAADAVQRVLADQASTPAAAQPSTGTTNTEQPSRAPQLDKSGSGSRHTYSEAAGAGAGSDAAQGQAVTTQQQQPSAASALERPHSSRRLSCDVSGKQQQQLEEQQAPQQAPPAAPVHSSTGAHRNSPRPAAVELPRPGSSGSSRAMSAMKAAPTLASPSSSPVRAHSPQQVSLGARPASGLRSAGRAPPGAPDTQSQLARPPSAGLGRPGSSSSHRRDTGDGFANILKKDGLGARSGRRPSPLLGGTVSSDDEDAPVLDLLAGDPLAGLSMAAQGVDTAAAAAGAQGVLVKDILSAEEELRRAGANAAAGAGDQGEGGTGIILKRQAKPTGGDASRRKPSDLASLADSVQKLCQVALPLARSLEFLQEDVDSMSKEHRFWVTERRVFQERLQEEQKVAADTCDLAAAVADQDNAIRSARARILTLRSQVLQGEQQINKVLSMLVNPLR